MSFLGLEAYELLKEQQLNDINSLGYILRHKKSGARIALVSNDDDNKVFYIGFRTPPTDETGVPHIIEHTVLCGSDKFPVKDPFVELVKGSLNTFLNAMTYPEKTMYPIASYNDKDFKNLMDVYMDAVFHPNILKYPEIFKQEGWHYELEDLDSPITINGVVYNEMKGAYSSPDEILTQAISEAVFPDNTYSKDSGGNPDHIPELTYEEYIEFYKKYYHPSNSYIYLYGDFDIKERLEWMDKEYLSQFSAIHVDSEIKPQLSFGKMKDVTKKYPIASDEPEENNTYLSYTKVIGDMLDDELAIAFETLDYALVNAPGAPVRKALIDAGIGQDVYSAYDNGSCQPTFSIFAKNANVEDKEKFVKIIEDTLKKVVKEGINQNSLLGSINSAEFRFRESDYGQFPKGLLYGISCMESWIFDDTNPFMRLDVLSKYASLKKKIGTGYYEELIQKYVLDNTHGAIVTLVPEKGLNQRKEEELEAKLAAYKETLSKEELEAIIEETRHLREYQETPSPEEDLEKIPMLGREDMRKEALPYQNIEEKIDNATVVRHDIFTNGIDYVSFYFDVQDISLDDVPYLGLLKTVLGYVNTENYSYMELANATNIYTGGINSGFNAYVNSQDRNKYEVRFEIRMRALEENLEKAFDLTKEMLFTSDIDDLKRMTEIIAQTKSRLQTVLSSSGHIVAANRSLSYISKYAYYQDAFSGVRFYDAICEMEELLKNNPQVLIDKLRTIMKQIFVKERVLVSFTADEECYKRAMPYLEAFIQSLPHGQKATTDASFVPEKKNEAFTDASAIQYVARVGNFEDHGFKYTGLLHVLKLILSYEYMWLNIRVKGGAYGCMSSFQRSGEVYFVSYRDPNLGKTLKVFEGIPEYLRSFQIDDRDMTKYVIGTFSAIDTPLNPEGKGNRSMIAYLKETRFEDIQRERNEILNVTQEDIRGLADMIESVVSDECICVVGNENNIRKEEALFMNIRKLTN